MAIAGIADVLFGDYNPAGRLVQTWVKSLDQLPPMMDYNIRNGRTYMYFKGDPLYPFGFGPSYTTFEYLNLRAASGKLSVNVTNIGHMTVTKLFSFTRAIRARRSSAQPGSWSGSTEWPYLAARAGLPVFRSELKRWLTGMRRWAD